MWSCISTLRVPTLRHLSPSLSLPVGCSHRRRCCPSERQRTCMCTSHVITVMWLAFLAATARSPFTWVMSWNPHLSGSPALSRRPRLAAALSGGVAEEEQGTAGGGRQGGALTHTRAGKSQPVVLYGPLGTDSAEHGDSVFCVVSCCRTRTEPQTWYAVTMQSGTRHSGRKTPRWGVSARRAGKVSACPRASRHCGLSMRCVGSIMGMLFT